MAEWDALFADAVVSAELINPQRVRATLEARPEVAAATADLAVRETECCSFFTFTLTATGGRLDLEIDVPVEQTRVLDALADRISVNGEDDHD